MICWVCIGIKDLWEIRGGKNGRGNGGKNSKRERKLNQGYQRRGVFPTISSPLK